MSEEGAGVVDEATNDESANGEAPGEPQTASAFSTWRLPIVLFTLTVLSTLWVGAQMNGVEDPGLADLWRGWNFSLPLMAILLAHEMGHYVAGRIHKVPVSPPHFIPLPFSLLGTMGAVISMSGRIRSRDALLDVGASGPIAGMVLALPLLIYGVYESPVEPLDMSQPILLEGHSLLYEAILFAVKGPFPAGHDITLTPTALAAWAGLFVTMLNLLPFGQLDGGHISYALIGRRQDRVSRWMVRILPVLALGVSAFYGGRSYLAGDDPGVVEGNAYAGVPWLVWGGLLLLMARYSGYEHPPTDDDTLSPKRRAVAIGCIVLFALLFMPAMLRSFDGSQ